MADAPRAEPSPTPRRPRLPNFISFALAVALVVLGGQIVRQGVSDNLLNDNPEAAVLWGGESPDAIAALARLRLRGRDPGGGARLAVKALRLAPLHAHALATYGLAMQALGQPQMASQAMTLAGQRGWR